MADDPRLLHSSYAQRKLHDKSPGSNIPGMIPVSEKRLIEKITRKRIFGKVLAFLPNGSNPGSSQSRNSLLTVIDRIAALNFFSPLSSGFATKPFSGAAASAGGDMFCFH